MDQDLLLPTVIPVEGAVDHRGRRASRSNSGGWTSAFFIIGVEMAERFAYYGVATNLITYLTGPLGESTAAAAANVNAWSGASSMLPLPLGLVADWWVGRYRTIVAASLLYVLALGMLTTSAVAPSLQPPKCTDGNACATNTYQTAFFFLSIYLISFAQGGHKPCVQAFGADQFDENDPQELKSKSSFFNWWYFGMCFATTFTVIGLSYVQDNIGWGLGFGIPFIVMAFALIVFLLGTKTYRFYLQSKKSLSANFGKAMQRLVKCRTKQKYPSGYESATIIIEDDPTCERQTLLAHGGSKYVDVCTCSSSNKDAQVEHKFDEEHLSSVLKLFPIWASCLVYGVVFSQSSTFFTKQGSTMDRRIGSTFQVPPAALQSFISLSIMIFIPVYDRILVPITRKFTGKPFGLALLQRIGVGMFLSMAAMMVAALVEIKRLQTAKEYGLIDSPGKPIPMSLWWLAPQYFLYGIADVFTIVGLQEFFYDQVPNGFRSLGLALYLSIFGVGSFISSALVSIIDKATAKGGGDSWFSNNLNRAHLDYFYWLLAAFSALQLILYLSFSQCYIYKKK